MLWTLGFLTGALISYLVPVTLSYLVLSFDEYGLFWISVMPFLYFKQLSIIETSADMPHPVG